MPSMQGRSEVHLVAEGWQVFVVRQTSSIPMPHEEDCQPQEEVAPVDESDEELVR